MQRVSVGRSPAAAADAFEGRVDEATRLVLQARVADMLCKSVFRPDVADGPFGLADCPRYAGIAFGGEGRPAISSDLPAPIVSFHAGLTDFCQVIAEYESRAAAVGTVYRMDLQIGKLYAGVDPADAGVVQRVILPR